MRLLNETEKAVFFIGLQTRMADFIEHLPSDHQIGYLPDNISELMAKAALNVIETVVDCNVFFETEKPCH